MRIFISYRRADTAGHAGRLDDSLQAHFGRENVFMDLSAIDSGQNFVDAIETAVRSCDALVAIIGDDWLTCLDERGRRLDDPADFVRSEISAALARGIPVFPVLVEGTTMPPADALPEVLKPLAKRQAHELSDRRWSYDVESLINAIEKLGSTRHVWDRRTRLSLAAAIVLLAIGVAVFAYRMLQDRGVTLATTSTTAATGTSLPGVDIAGDWRADVTYSWGDKHPERFTFKQDGNDVFGTASFLRVRRGIVGGVLNGNSLQFQTQTEEISGDSTRTVTHRYRGRIAGNVITFSMQSEGASSSQPIEFTATRGEPAQSGK